MRILWVSLRLFSDKEEKQSAVWLKSLALRLTEISELKLANISSGSGKKVTTQCDYKNISQWAIPVKRIKRNGLPDDFACNEFRKVVAGFAPDIVQIWGSENPFQLLPFQPYIPGVKVMTMQGVMASIHPVLFNGLTFKELLSTISLREILTQRNLFTIRKSFRRDAVREELMIKMSQFIITQSEWTDSQIRHLNTNALYFRTDRVLRDEFYSCRKWTEFEHRKPVIYSAAIGYSLKGLHVLIKALSIVKKSIPEIELRLAGATGRKDFLGEGYLRFIIRLSKRMGVYSNIKWLGAINSSEIVKNLQEASVFVNPSYVESYSMVVAEAMAVGTPSVISFAGAMPELAVNRIEAFFFSPGDYYQLAYYILQLLNSHSLSLEISHSAIKRSKLRQSNFHTTLNQFKIYENILNERNNEVDPKNWTAR